jgi:gluconate:H+ symporter, GntP family
MIASAEIFIGGKAAARSVTWQCIGDPIFALLISCLLGIALMKMTVDNKTTQSVMAKSVADAGTVLLLTCAGGGFGVALKDLGVGEAIVKIFPNTLTPTGLLVTAFGTTALIRGAQGSATVAMITTVAIVESLVSKVELTYHPVYLALAIGCGSKPLAWMNDSGFWQVASMTGMTAIQTLKTFSAALTIMGCVGFLVVLLGSWFLPLV